MSDLKAVETAVETDVGAVRTESRSWLSTHPFAALGVGAAVVLVIVLFFVL